MPATAQRRPHRTVRLPLILLSAAIPVALAAGCSSGAPKAASAPSASVRATPSPTPSVRYASLPAPCSVLSSKTLRSLVPGAKSVKGTPAGAGSTSDRGGCSWNGLKGYQYRYLDTSAQRFDNVAGGGSAADQAASAYTAAVQATATTAKAGQASPTTTAVSGVGDEAALLTWASTKDKDTYLNATVVTRSANVVLTVDYVGAGLQGDKKPKQSDLASDVQRAAKEALSTLK